jgi:hypothetical protein
MTKSESTKSRTGAGNASPERVRHADSKSGWLRALTGHKYSLLFGLLHPRTHQAKSTTKLNRYPEIFAAATKAAPSARKILSFGCSTGEECVTLANYFPTAQIIGADINVLNLTWAPRRVVSPSTMTSAKMQFRDLSGTPFLDHPSIAPI